jgi:hypothetical protein
MRVAGFQISGKSRIQNGQYAEQYNCYWIKDFHAANLIVKALVIKSAKSIFGSVKGSTHSLV